MLRKFSMFSGLAVKSNVSELINNTRTNATEIVNQTAQSVTRLGNSLFNKVLTVTTPNNSTSTSVGFSDGLHVTSANEAIFYTGVALTISGLAAIGISRHFGNNGYERPADMVVRAPLAMKIGMLASFVGVVTMIGSFSSMLDGAVHGSPSSSLRNG